VVPFFERELRRTHGDLLLVSHGGVNRVLLCHLLGVPLANLFRLGQDRGALTIIRWHAQDFVVERLNLDCPDRSPSASRPVPRTQAVKMGLTS